MITIESLVEQGANVKLEVTPADLKMFAEAIVQRTMAARQEELNAEMRRVAEETWLNTRQVRELLNVCEGTLNLWAKRGYLCGRSAATSSPSRWATRTCMPDRMSVVCRREASSRV